MRTLTPEARQQGVDARKAKQEGIALKRAKRISVDGWHVFRFDDMNIVLQQGDNVDVRYYPAMKDALLALLRHLVAEKSAKATDAKGLIKAIETAEKNVLSAISQFNVSM